MKKLIAALMVSGLAASGVLYASSDEMVLAHRQSCGYKCSPDGRPGTPSAPKVDQDLDHDGIVDDSIKHVDWSMPIDLIEGRTNVHSGGRLHGSANKRVGCGGCRSHPADWDFAHPGVTHPMF